MLRYRTVSKILYFLLRTLWRLAVESAPATVPMGLFIKTCKDDYRVSNVRVVLQTFIGYARCDAHMNELPVPCGPWEPWYNDKQSFYNKVLLGGILWWLFSLGMMLYTNSIYLNWSPPLQPGPPSDMVEECEDT